MDLERTFLSITEYPHPIYPEWAALGEHDDIDSGETRYYAVECKPGVQTVSRVVDGESWREEGSEHAVAVLYATPDGGHVARRVYETAATGEGETMYYHVPAEFQASIGVGSGDASEPVPDAEYRDYFAELVADRYPEWVGADTGETHAPEAES